MLSILCALTAPLPTPSTVVPTPPVAPDATPLKSPLPSAPVVSPTVCPRPDVAPETVLPTLPEASPTVLPTGPPCTCVREVLELKMGSADLRLYRQASFQHRSYCRSAYYSALRNGPKTYTVPSIPFPTPETVAPAPLPTPPTVRPTPCVAPLATYSEHLYWIRTHLRSSTCHTLHVTPSHGASRIFTSLRQIPDRTASRIARILGRLRSRIPDSFTSLSDSRRGSLPNLVDFLRCWRCASASRFVEGSYHTRLVLALR